MNDAGSSYSSGLDPRFQPQACRQPSVNSSHAYNNLSTHLQLCLTITSSTTFRKHDDTLLLNDIHCILRGPHYHKQAHQAIEHSVQAFNMANAPAVAYYELYRGTS